MGARVISLGVEVGHEFIREQIRSGKGRNYQITHRRNEYEVKSNVLFKKHKYKLIEH